jgi:hypothetical protein|uniref:Uncharacterized protein n=1 Tax=Siphoviridae sp. ctNHj22 TaxID=2825468 RepID=A0A8S5VFP1_9CAUD|nr:MAG TPA: hypothetical protein [Siphoviridae sp. ctNHj22]
MLDKLNHLKDEMCEELMELTDKKNRSPGDVEMIGEIVDIILDIHRIEDYCESGEYSRAGEWEADMHGNYGRTENYSRGNSYANRGRHYVRGHYSRGDGREKMISDIEDMMQDATGAERDAYKRAADILRNA